jgi:hypothetical protein
MMKPLSRTSVSLPETAMRQAFDRQLKLDVPKLTDIKFDPTSRHELEAILMALHHLYQSPKTQTEILALIAKDINDNTNPQIGCTGLTYWEILVLAAVRLGCNLDYDALADLASNHRKLRCVLGIGEWGGGIVYRRSTIQDNLAKLKPETIQQISNVIVAEGHTLVPEAVEKVRGDSFVVQTNIHYPTDANVLVDGVRKILTLSAQLGELLEDKTWQYWRNTFRGVKKLYRKIQKIAANKSLRKEDKEEKFEPRYEELINKATTIASEALNFKGQIALDKITDAPTRQRVEKRMRELAYYIHATVYVAWLADRRVLSGEVIPHAEKLHSVFEPHTELINRGKFPFPIEFGHPVFVVEDQIGFILDHKIMKDAQTDDQVVVARIKALQTRMHNRIKTASFDKGFWSPANLAALDEVVEVSCLPKKGKRDFEAKVREGAQAFRQARRWHPGVESAIHALVDGNGLAVCRDRGEEGYERYVAFGILGRNLHTLGRLLLDRAQDKQKSLRRAA